MLVSFTRFVEILYELGKLTMQYKDKELDVKKINEDVAVAELLKSQLFVRANANYQEKSSKFEDWFIELEKPDVVEFLNSQKAMLLAVIDLISFRGYRDLRSTSSIIENLADALRWTSSSSSVKNLVSYQVCYRKQNVEK